MRSNILRAWSVLTLVGLVVLLFGQIATAEDWGNSLLGTWQVQVTQVDCQTGAALGPAFPSLLTFAVGGTMAEDTTNPVFGPGQRGAGQGVWGVRGRSSYAAKSVAFINYTTQPDPQTHNPGFEAGQQAITQDITFDRHSGQWSSQAEIVFTDTTGAVYRQGCAIASGKRF